MSITRAVRKSDKTLVKFRIKEGIHQVCELSKGSKWNSIDVNDYLLLKTKTLKCTGLDHSNPIKKSFKVDKRYQVESGRALGGVAGYIFDEDGHRWTLFREDVGFSIADGTTFEAKYL